MSDGESKPLGTLLLPTGLLRGAPQNIRKQGQKISGFIPNLSSVPGLKTRFQNDWVVAELADVSRDLGQLDVYFSEGL